MTQKCQFFLLCCNKISVTVRDFADNARGWRASVPSLAPTSATEQKHVCVVTFTPQEVAPLVGSGGARAPASSPETRIWSDERPRKQEIKRRKFLNNNRVSGPRKFASLQCFTFEIPSFGHATKFRNFWSFLPLSG